MKGYKVCATDRSDRQGCIYKTFKSRASADRTYKSFKKYFRNVWIEEIELAKCPYCSKLEEKEIIKDFGMCLRCDKIRGDAYLERASK